MIISKRNAFISLWLVILVATIYTLMHISYQVQHLEGRLKSINAEVKNENNNIRTLNAEWSYLTDPSRIEKLSAELLPNLTIVKAHDISKIENIKEATNIIAISDETDSSQEPIKVFIGNAE